MTADEMAVQAASVSRDLSKMRDALSLPASPLRRHFLLQNIALLAYKQRKNHDMADLVLTVGRQHRQELPGIIRALETEFRTLPRMPIFETVAAVLVECGQLAEAKSTIETAMRYALEDGTKGGYAARRAKIERLELASAKASKPAAPSPRPAGEPPSDSFVG